MMASQKLAIAAHLHVLLRRRTGRVTDTEWMAENQEYALEIVRFARVKASEDGHAELAEWADKLERAALEPAAVHKPLAQSAMQLIRERTAAVSGTALVKPASPHSSGFGNSVFRDSTNETATASGNAAPDADAHRYVGGIR
jgi:hypothetical protein